MKKYALIMAGGEGRRAGGELPKQFHKLLGIPMLWWPVTAFHREDPDTEISIVMHPGFFDEYDRIIEEMHFPKEITDRVRLVAGGRNRSHSVSNGILALPDTKEALIAVHDAARPMVTAGLIRNGWECAAKNGTAVPVVPVTDSLREITPDGSKAIDRSRFVAVQTPQIFRADILKAAYRLEDKPFYTDDASRVEDLGIKITLFDGESQNLKVTNPTDFAIAESLLSSKN